MSPFIRQVRAFEGETVEIAWHLNDGTTWSQRLTIAPKATRDARSTATTIPADGITPAADKSEARP